MKTNWNQSIRIKQLSEQLTGSIHEIQRPVGGWIRAIRQALGLSLSDVGSRLKKSSQAIHLFEKREAKGTISLYHLEQIAGAMGCRVVYAFVPVEGTLEKLAQEPAAKSLNSLRHSMALEGQQVEEPQG